MNYFQNHIHPDQSTNASPNSALKSTQHCVWRPDVFREITVQFWAARPAYYLSLNTGFPERTIERHLRLEGGKPNIDHGLGYFCIPDFGDALRDAMSNGGLDDEGSRNFRRL